MQGKLDRRAGRATKHKMEQLLDRYTGLEMEARAILAVAMKECSFGPRHRARGIMRRATQECQDGPRLGQKMLRAEIRHFGVPLKTFDAVWRQHSQARFEQL